MCRRGQFASAYDRISELGEVLNEHQGSEDVSEQFIDLEARLKSALREEQSFLSLLGRASNVSEVLAIERELARVRADIERYQGQLDFLSRRVDLSTIYVELVPEEGPFIEPPNGYLRLTVDDVPGSMDRVRSIIASYEGEIRGGTIYSDDGEQRADLDARVFYADFRNVLSELERVGDVASKSIREPVLDLDGGVERDPEARISIQLEEPTTHGSTSWAPLSSWVHCCWSSSSWECEASWDVEGGVRQRRQRRRPLRGGHAGRPRCPSRDRLTTSPLFGKSSTWHSRTTPRAKQTSLTRSVPTRATRPSFHWWPS